MTKIIYKTLWAIVIAGIAFFPTAFIFGPRSAVFFLEAELVFIAIVFTAASLLTVRDKVLSQMFKKEK